MTGDETPDPEATQAMDQVDRPVPPAVVSVPAEAPDPAPAPAASTPTGPSAIDSLFGDSNFQQYDEGVAPVVPVASKPPKAPASPTEKASRRQKVLIATGGALVALLALVALFFLGTRLPTILGSPVAAPTITPTARHTPTPTPTPTSTVTAVGPVAVGVHGWNELRGGECLDPYTTPWAEKFTVVDCAAAHPAQMVYRGTFDPAKTPTFPGADALQQQIGLLCAAPGVLDLGAAGQYTDAQVQAAYPVTQAEWDAGQHDYFCFVSRSSGQALTGSVAAAATP